MHLLYLDESGTIGDSAHKHFVLAGAAIREQATQWIEQDLHQVAKRFHPANPSAIELHASPMRSGKGTWRRLTVADRSRALLDCLEIVRSHWPHNLRLFGAVTRKCADEASPTVEVAFEHLCRRFDIFLRNLPADQADAHRGLILFDKSAIEQRIQRLSLDFKHFGHRCGTPCHSAEVPVFLDSRASRLIQLADLIAFALFRKHEFGDDRFFAVIQDCFDSSEDTDLALPQRH